MGNMCLPSRGDGENGAGIQRSAETAGTNVRDGVKTTLGLASPDDAKPVTPEPVDLASVMPPESAAAIRRVFPDGPRGSFVRARYGCTHYLLESPPTPANEEESAGGPRKLVLLSHGLGTNLHVYDDLADALVSSGYTVLRYEFFNHGFSKANDVNLRITDDVMMHQVEDLLDHVCHSPSESVHGVVGHSTGGVVGVLAAKSESLRKRKIRKLALVSPALWASKPLIARMADRTPGALDFALRYDLPQARKALVDAYIANTDAAFAKDPDTGIYRYPRAYKEALGGNHLMFRNHPYVAGGIGGINAFFLREDLLPRWREALRDVAARVEDPVETRLIFGTEDVVVDYKSQFLAELRKLERVEVSPIDRQGHESLYENTAPIATVVTSFLA